MIGVGIGGWTFEPWEGTFYPSDLPKSRQLEYATRHVTAIEVNGTFYRTQTPATFRKWADGAPDGFVYTLKAPRYAVSRKDLSEAGESIGWFVKSGIAELGDKLGAVLWQLQPNKQFDETEIAAFLKLMPQEADGVPVRNALEVRHESFVDPRFVALACDHGVAIVYADSDGYPAIADRTADFAYARLQRTLEEEEAGYPADALDAWAACARAWEAGKVPPGLPVADKKGKKAKPGPAFVFFIAGAKVRNPAAAQALIERLA